MKHLSEPLMFQPNVAQGIPLSGVMFIAIGGVTNKIPALQQFIFYILWAGE
jgi:hypothetical protein